MTVTLVRYYAARKALAAARRVDEAKQIRDKAEAVRVYTKQARDFELQNQAAEIRLFAERRAGELLADMAKNPGTRGQGRPRKDGTKITRSIGATAYLPTLDDIGVTRDQSSKWQRLAKMIDDATFETAIIRAKERNGELTSAGLLREINQIGWPARRVIEPDINVVAADLARDIDSVSRRNKLQEVVRLRNRLNPTIRKSLITALKNGAREVAAFEKELSADFRESLLNGKCHQRVIREQMAEQPEPDLVEKRKLAGSMKNALVKRIDYETARNLVLANEYLGSMGSTEKAFALYFGPYIAGVACFGRTAGTNVATSICGFEHADKVITICRGCCCWWAHPHSGSFLLSAACREMTKLGYHLFVAYSDPTAGELGVLYQACNFLYCGTTNPREKFRTPDGKIYDARQVHCLTRDRTIGVLKYKRDRAEQKQILQKQGCEFFVEGDRKHRYVGIYGDRHMKRTRRRALQWKVLPYPKRPQVSD